MKHIGKYCQVYCNFICSRAKVKIRVHSKSRLSFGRSWKSRIREERRSFFSENYLFFFQLLPLCLPWRPTRNVQFGLMGAVWRLTKVETPHTTLSPSRLQFTGGRPVAVAICEHNSSQRVAQKSQTRLHLQFILYCFLVIILGSIFKISANKAVLLLLLLLPGEGQTSD